MRVTSIGHAGLLVETVAGRILCDPWFNPAYFGSWFPFPDNSGVDQAALGDAEYLYVSHLHHDHFDPEWLRTHMSKDTRVLLPDYPVPDLRRAMEELGFRHFVHTRDQEVHELDGSLRVMINALTTPTDGPIGDSALVVEDSTARILNQNDARPVEHDALCSLGPFDGHFLQYSGAIWFPMVYDFPDRMKATVGRRKRLNGMARALRYIEEYGAAHVFPFAGPPCFLDDDLFHLNDFEEDETNTFPDQWVFLDHMREQGHHQGKLFLPGTTAELRDGRCELEQIPEERIAPVRDERRTYLRDYQRRKRPVLRAERESWPTERTDLLSTVKEWVEPLMRHADHTCAGVNGRVLVETTDEPPARAGEPERIVFDFLDRTVRRYEGETCRYRFRVPRPLLESLVRDRTADWVNELFLSCRFQASRQGPFNEYVTTFFATLSEERMSYAEGFYAEAADAGEKARAGDHVIQRYCPHLKADLVRFGTHKDGVLTCRMHGWEFDLATGRCLTSDDRKLFSEPLDASEGAEGAAEGAEGTAHAVGEAAGSGAGSALPEVPGA